MFLVGGFAKSNYLSSVLEAYFKDRNISILRADATHLYVMLPAGSCHGSPAAYKVTRNKAVADGSLSYYLDHHVSKRVAKFFYGVRANPIFDPENEEHRHRGDKIYLSPSGKNRVSGAFSTILKKVNLSLTLFIMYVESNSVLPFLKKLNSGSPMSPSTLQKNSKP